MKKLICPDIHQLEMLMEKRSVILATVRPQLYQWYGSIRQFGANSPVHFQVSNRPRSDFFFAGSVGGSG